MLQAACTALRSRGWLLFTVEARDAGEDYRIEPHGRYSHSAGYLGRACAAAGLLQLDTRAVVLRKEAGEPVAGWLVQAQKA